MLAAEHSGCLTQRDSLTPGAEVMGCLDWGWAPHPGYFALCAFDQYGRGVGYKEATFTELTAREVAEQIIAPRCVTDMERKAIIVGDSQMWAPQASKHGVSIAQEINEALAELGLELPNINRDPAPTPEPELPASVMQFLEGFTEPEVRDEFTEDARKLAARGLSSTDIISRLAGGATAGA